MTHNNEANPELLKELEQLKQSVTGLQSLLDAANQERIRLENELALARQKVEESERLNYAWFASMRHEMRTPINAILGFSDLLNDPNITIEKRKMFIELIKNACQSLVKTLNPELEFKKVFRTRISFHEFFCVFLHVFLRNQREIFYPVLLR